MDGVLSPPQSDISGAPNEPSDAADAQSGPGTASELVVVTPSASFEEFYRQHHREVANALSITLGSSELGVEAADEGMARAFSNWGTVSGYDNAAGWVYRVGLNWALSRLRRLSRRLPWSEKPTYTMPTVGDPTVAAALQELDIDQRSVVVLRLLLDWSTNETAAALDIKTGTVKSRLSRALAVLAEKLEGHE